MRFGIVALGLLSVACSGVGRSVDIRAGSLSIGIDSRGWVVSFADLRAGREYLPRGHDAPILTLRVDDLDVEPVAAAFGPADSILALEFENGMEARIRVRIRDTHATFELLSVTDPSAVVCVSYCLINLSIAKK